MMRLFRVIWMFVARLRLPKQAEWSREDATNLAHFLRSTTGLKLNLIMQQRIIAMMEHAAQTAQPKDCGLAIGVRAGITFINSLASAPTGIPETPPNGQAGSLDHLRP